nr:PQQ-binding-like beta-propeller repeat protein [Paenibacillus sp. GSMTC-2017]
MAGARDVIILYRGDFEEDNRIITLDAETGKVLWEKSYKEQFKIVNDNGVEPYILLKQEQTLFALQPQTGNLQWEVSSDKFVSHAQEESFHTGVYIELRMNPFQSQQPYEWVRLGKELVLINLASGNVQARYELQLKEVVTIVDEKYLLLQRALDARDFLYGNTFETTLYNIAEEKPLWTIAGRGSGPIIDGDRLYLTLDGAPTAVDIITGHMVWKTATKELGYVDSPSPAKIMSSKPLLFWIGEDLLHIDKNNGSIKGQLEDVKLGFPEARDTYIRNGLINSDGEAIYLGSADSYFSKFEVGDFLTNFSSFTASP